MVANPAEGHSLPSSLNQIRVLTRFQLLNYIRARRLYLLLGIFAGIGALLTGLIGYFRPAGWLDGPLAFYSNWWGNGVFIIGVVPAIIFGGDAIAGEFQNRTGYFLIAHPIRRSVIYVGKYLAGLAASLLSILFFAAITVGNAIYYFGAARAFPVAFAESVLLMCLYVAAVLAATFLFSSLFKTSTYAVLVTAVLFLFAFMLIQSIVTTLAVTEPWYLISYGGQVVGDILVVPYPPHTVLAAPALGTSPVIIGYNPTLPEGIAVMLGYLLVSGLLGLYLFEREQFTG